MRLPFMALTENVIVYVSYSNSSEVYLHLSSVSNEVKS